MEYKCTTCKQNMEELGFTRYTGGNGEVWLRTHWKCENKTCTRYGLVTTEYDL